MGAVPLNPFEFQPLMMACEAGLFADAQMRHTGGKGNANRKDEQQSDRSRPKRPARPSQIALAGKCHPGNI